MRTIVFFLMLTLGGFAADFDVDPEVRPTVNKAKIVDLIIHLRTKQMIIEIAKGYEDGGTFYPIKSQTFILMNKDADPDSGEPATTDFTDALVYIGFDKTKVKNLILSLM